MNGAGVTTLALKIPEDLGVVPRRVAFGEGLTGMGCHRVNPSKLWFPPDSFRWVAVLMCSRKARFESSSTLKISTRRTNLYNLEISCN